MTYELSTLEWELDPQQIKNTFTDFSNRTNIKTHKKSVRKIDHSKKFQQNEKQEAYYYLIEKFERLFIREFHRIHSSINIHKINDTEEVFIRYITINYTGLIKLFNKKEALKPPGSVINNPDFFSNYLQYTTTQIKYSLQTLLVIPLKEFIEINFKEALFKKHLLDSPIDVFIKAIKNNEVELMTPKNIPKENYKSILSPAGNQLFILEYNGHHIEALYHNHLKEKYDDFRDHLEVFVESSVDVLEKIKLLSHLNTSISEMNDLFFKDSSLPNHRLKRLKNYRKDAGDNLKLKLHYHNILNDFVLFSDALGPLIEIQYIFIKHAQKFIKSNLHSLKFNHETKSDGDHPDEAIKRPLAPVEKPCPGISEKLQWRGNINQLITFFYDASTQVFIDDKPILKAQKKDLVLFLTKNFIQKDGNPINPTTVKTIMTPSKELKRPPLYKRITIPH